MDIMRSLVTIILILNLSEKSFGQIVTRTNETTEQFISRIKPDSLKVAHSVIETTIWTKGKKSIIAFLGYHEPKNPNAGFDYVSGLIFFPVDNNKYKTIKLDQIVGDGGGSPEVISVFFANADRDGEKELIVLVKFWERSLFHMGNSYQGFVFDNPTADKDLITYDDVLWDKFRGCDCDYTGQKSTKAKFKTAQDIKDELKRMGY